MADLAMSELDSVIQQQLKDLVKQGWPWQEVARGVLALFDWLIDCKQYPEHFGYGPSDLVMVEVAASGHSKYYSPIDIVRNIMNRLGSDSIGQEDVFVYIFESIAKTHKYVQMSDDELKAKFDELIKRLQEFSQKSSGIRKDKDVFEQLVMLESLEPGGEKI